MTIRTQSSQTSPTDRRVGVWLVGAYGNVATLAVAGAAAIAQGLTPPEGLVTEGPGLHGLGLATCDELVFGGHEVREGSLVESAEAFAERDGVLTPALLACVRDELVATDARIRPGVLLGTEAEVTAFAGARVDDAETPRQALERLRRDLREFARSEHLDQVVVVNLASTEAEPGGPALESLAALRAALDADDAEGVPASVLYAVAALECGFPFVDFTPAVASSCRAVLELAHERRVPCMGRDGKTGETLVKTVLAPMFVARNLRVLSWEGVNMLGNRDGAVLRDPGASASKVRDKDQALRRILRDPETHSSVRIDYVPSLSDWKQAYDFIHFQGFLGTRMQMHFLWQGCDSALAAPLVLDLVRLADLAARRGESGPLPQLACFFKSPVGVGEQAFAAQMEALYGYAAEVRAERQIDSAEVTRTG